jgi:hypothetical protein
LCSLTNKFSFHLHVVFFSHYFSSGRMKTLQKYLISLVFLTLFAIAFLLKTSINVEPIKTVPKCGRYPKQIDIHYDNEMWQILYNPDGRLFLWNAYLDLRWNRSVVINAIGAALNQTAENFFCQYWFEGKDDPIVVQAFRFQNLWRISELRV